MTFSAGNRALRRERGSVLVMVLWLSLGLVSLALVFGHAMMLEYRAAANAVAGVEAAHVIKGAKLYITHVLRDLEEPGQMPSEEDFEVEGVELGNGLFWLLGRGDGMDVGEEPTFGLVDEASKLNLNTASREMLEELPGMTAELAAAVIDWRDEDDELTPDGAELETYLRQTPAYQCKNGPFETVAELMLVHGASEQILLGRDTNLSGAIDAWEDPEETDPALNWSGLGTGAGSIGQRGPNGGWGESVETFGLLEYLTVYSREPNTRADGSERINVNNTSGSGPGSNNELTELLQEALGEQRGRQVGQGITRALPSFQNPETRFSLLGLFVQLRLDPQVSLTQEEFATFEKDITYVEQQQGQEADVPEYLPGLVNVNTASRVVLDCIPGIAGTGYAEKLVLHRADMEEGLDSIAWVSEVLEDDVARQAGPYLTTRSYQFSADIAAVRNDGRGFRRTLFVFDTSGDEPIVVYRRDRSRLGWALGDAVRQGVSTIQNESGYADL